MTPSLAPAPTTLLRVPLRAVTTLLPQITVYPGITSVTDPIHLEIALFRLIVDHPDQRRDDLRWDIDLHRVARLRVEDMRERAYFSHVNPDGVGPDETLRRNGIVVPDWYGHGLADNHVESLALNKPDAAIVFAALLASPAHRAHVLGEGGFETQLRMGIGVGPTWETPPAQMVWCLLTLGDA